MSSKSPEVSAAVRIASSSLTDAELAYLVDLLASAGGTAGFPSPIPGWSKSTDCSMWHTFREAARVRGITNGVRVVTQTVDLRS